MTDTATTYPERTWSFGRCADAPDGPWKTEPDKVQWVDPTTGLDCLIVRNRSGALCGYVGVPAGHPWFEGDYDAVRVDPADDDSWPDVHGGLTFAGFCHEGKGDGDGICHVPYPGRTDRVYWLGFDTAHAGDVCPNHMRLYEGLRGEGSARLFGETYKTLGYVKAEVASLAAQADSAARRRRRFKPRLFSLARYAGIVRRKDA